MQRPKAQSAMEFLATYSYALLIIAIALAVLILYFSLPKTILPLECNFFSDFTCTDAALVGNAAGGPGASLIIVGIDNQPGIVNASKFSAYINYANSIVGFCLPSRVTAGQYIYCVANFTFTPKLSSIYYGTFNISANYCAPMAGNLSTAACATSSNFVFGGSVRLQAQASTPITNTINSLISGAPFTFYYAPVTILNSQPVASGAPLQVMLTFPSNAYGNYIHPQWNNVEFSTLPAAGGASLEAWVENAPSNAVGNTIVWVDLPQGIPANSAITIYANFLPANIMSANGPTGEAPQLSGTGNYALYDDGAQVFDFYDNFAGTTLNANNWGTQVGNAPVVNNALEITETAAGYTSGIASKTTFSSLQTLVFDADIVAGTAGSDNHDSGLFLTPSTITSAQTWTGAWGSSVVFWGMHTTTEVLTQSGGASGGSVNGGAFTYPFVASASDQGTSSFTGNFNYGSITQATSTTYVPALPSSYLVLGTNWGGSTSSYVTYQWVRARNYPPNGVMPSASYGSVFKAT